MSPDELSEIGLLCPRCQRKISDETYEEWSKSDWEKKEKCKHCGHVEKRAHLIYRRATWHIPREEKS